MNVYTFFAARCFLFIAFFLSCTFPARAQCVNWRADTRLVDSSNCAASGEFEVLLSGADTANLTHIQYGIPLTAGGFSVPLNNSAIFTDIPPGYYTVSVIADCGGNIVGKNTQIFIPGSYSPPGFWANGTANSWDCPGAFGTFIVSPIGGRAPYTILITNAPPAYTGLRSITTSGNLEVKNAPSGSYAVRVVDACGSGTATQAVSVSRNTFSGVSVTALRMNAITCDSVAIYPQWPVFYGADDSLIECSMLLNGVTAAPPFLRSSQLPFKLKLPVGMTIKDLYGKSITFSLKFRCTGQVNTSTVTVMAPTISSQTGIRTCTGFFSGSNSVTGSYCMPLTYRIVNSVTGALFVADTTSSETIYASNLPVGNYTTTATTADGYVLQGGLTAFSSAANPYSITVMPAVSGLEGYIEGFQLSSVNLQPRNITIDLYSGPTGYSYHNSGFFPGNQWLISTNQTPYLPNTLYFIKGDYTFRITDECGVYYLPVRVRKDHIFHYTIGMNRQREACEGLWIWPAVTAFLGSSGVGGSFCISRAPSAGLLFNGQYFNRGDSVLITEPGDYLIHPTSSRTHLYQGIYPNPYTVSYAFRYDRFPFAVNINRTQGFACVGASAGQGKIYTEGMNGMPFRAPSHYLYALADSGKGAFGPYLQSNATGIFTNFGGSANQFFDVRVEDSCGVSAVQQVKILDMERARLITASKYVPCPGDSVQLTAAYFPDATYVWAGPNGFTATSRTVAITSISQTQVGMYKVAIYVPVCGQTIHDSTRIALSRSPLKPTISLTVDCKPPGSFLTIEHPTASSTYYWDATTYYNGNYFHSQFNSDTGFRKYVTATSSWRGVAVDTVSGCMAFSDSVYTNDIFLAGPPVLITSIRPIRCVGDTTLIYTLHSFSANARHQWYRNGLPVAGANSAYYFTTMPGNYRLISEDGVCRKDTSNELLLSMVPVPEAFVTASNKQACKGDTIILQAPVGADYSYTWQRNGITVLGAASNELRVTQAGIYQVTVANTGCARSSDSIILSFIAPPVVTINPSAGQYLCTGDTITLSSIAMAGYQYQWYRDSVVISGAAHDHYHAIQAGRYTLKVSTAVCSNVFSNTVYVYHLPEAVSLGMDTVVCNPTSFAMRLAVDSGFDQVTWSTGQTTQSIQVTTPGSYWVRAANKCGIYLDSIRIRPLTDYLPALPDDAEICNQYGVGVFSVPALLKNIKWSTGATTASVPIKAAGTYWVEGESPCGILHDTMKVNFCAPEISRLRLPKDTICEGDCIKLSAEVGHYPQQYEWILPGGNPSVSNAEQPYPVCYEKAGIYPVTLKVSNAGGADSMTTQLVVAVRPIPRFTDTTVVIGYKKNIVLPACAEAAVVAWYRDDSLVCADCKSISITGLHYRSVYYCVVSNGGCVDSCVYKMQVIDIPHDIWLPDAFTPNGDGRNDVFRIITDNPNVYGIDLNVYNRYGQKVHVSHSGYDGWDGRVNGTDADAGTYFWLLHYRVLGTDEYFSRQGDVVLIR